MNAGPHRSLRRRHVLAATAVAVAVIGAIVGLTESLRHPPGPVPAPGELEGTDRDPRLPVTCPEPQPREGERDAGRAPPPTVEPVAVAADLLLDCPESFDGRRVAYRGEVVGGLLRRGGGAWAQLNDDGYAEDPGPLPGHREYRGANTGVGVLLPIDLAGEIGVVGGPQTRGDVVEVVGVFRRVDPATGEVVVIRAQSGEVVRPGAPLTDPPLRERQVAAGVLALLAVGMVAFERFVSRRRQRV